MEIAMEFATFCNICFNKNNLRKIEQTEDLTRILMLFIENKILIKEQDIYLCLNCCEKLESYDKFKEMCLRNFIDFRIEYSELKKKLEMMKDPNMENKLRNFIETKVNGVNDRLSFDATEDPLNVEYNVISGQKSVNNIPEKEDGYSYNLHNVKCKTEKVEYDETEDYKLRTELDLEDNDENPELPVPIEHIKLESYPEEDVYTSESSNENVLIKQLRSKGPYQMNKSNDLITNLIHEEHSSLSTLNKNDKSTSRKTSDVDCEICKKTFSSASSLTRHTRIHTGEKPYTCKPCNKSFTSSTALRNHEQVHSGEKLHSCDVCNKTFATESYLESHKWVHNEDKRHICKICNKGFCLSKRLKKHMIIHTDKKPFPCVRCSKKFRTSRELKRHERAHTGEKPYACSMCDKTFSQNGNLKKHELVHTGEKPYTCATCQKPFRHVNHLRTHERVHTGEKPYECTLCGKRFTNGTSFKSHKLTHTGEKPYSCTVCHKSFRKSNTLREHEFIHTGVKPYSCDICKKKFTWGSELRLHKKKPCVQNFEQEKETEEPEKT